MRQAPKPSQKPGETGRETTLPLSVTAVTSDQAISWNPARNREPRIIKMNTGSVFHAQTHNFIKLTFTVLKT